VGGDGPLWTVINAAPDLRQQIEATPALQPKIGLRSTPIGAVVLTSGEVDSVAGLLHLRERQPFDLMATARIQRVLDANPIFEVLDRTIVRRLDIALEDDVALPGGVTVRLFAVAGKVPLYLENETEAGPDHTVGAEVSHDGARFFYIPSCAAMTPALAARLGGADTVMFDGTLWRDDEMIQQGLGTKTGRRMGHMSLAGSDGTLAAFAELGVRRKIFIHINNSNPILLEDSPQRAEATRAGWHVAFDGMGVSF
jgi:pyrroloquinoline quinone biosynthesis protein B